MLNGRLSHLEGELAQAQTLSQRHNRQNVELEKQVQQLKVGILISSNLLSFYILLSKTMIGELFLFILYQPHPQCKKLPRCDMCNAPATIHTNVDSQ